MAEWLMRGTVNTFFRGSIPLDTYLIICNIKIFFFLLYCQIYKIIILKKLKIFYN